MHVFIDTNILLNFFHFTKEEIDALSNVFASHAHGAATVHLTEQVCDEFLRNRENKIKDALKKFKDVKFAAQLPAFMKQYEEYEQIRQKSAELQELVKAMSQKVDVDVVENGLLTDTLVKDIFNKSNPIPTTPELFGKAQMRMALGNPPGKNGSIGDAVNWMALIDAVPDGENLHVISEDGDFYSTLDGGVRNSVCEAGRDFSTVRPAEGPSRP
ncbi:MAG: PIN domain-containing protein [Sulfuritalea sp.]|nr:PIN domain-containing protein [Sulfuritalea sp.]